MPHLTASKNKIIENSLNFSHFKSKYEDVIPSSPAECKLFTSLEILLPEMQQELGSKMASTHCSVLPLFLNASNPGLYQVL
jgi:hypothetical protein